MVNVWCTLYVCFGQTDHADHTANDASQQSYMLGHVPCHVSSLFDQYLQLTCRSSTCCGDAFVMRKPFAWSYSSQASDQMICNAIMERKFI